MLIIKKKKKQFLQNLHMCIWAFCSYIDLCVGHLHFLCGMIIYMSQRVVLTNFTKATVRLFNQI